MLKDVDNLVFVRCNFKVDACEDGKEPYVFEGKATGNDFKTF